MPKPPWLSEDLYPFEDHHVELDGTRVHYVDEGDGLPLLMLHGNPTWSFLYRDLIKGLRHQFRCIAPDFPGFGLSTAPMAYGYTPAEHADVLERLFLHLDLTDVILMTQDWGGPIGFALAGRHPERFSAFVIGNTWAWPMSNPSSRFFSAIMGGLPGKYLVARRNIFVERIIPSGVKRMDLPQAVMDAYRGPFPTKESRRPIQVLAREIMRSRPFLAEVERGLPALRDRPALLLWPTNDPAFRDAQRQQWETIFPHHHTVLLPNTGHYMQEDSAQEIVDGIQDWAQSERIVGRNEGS